MLDFLLSLLSSIFTHMELNWLLFIRPAFVHAWEFWEVLLIYYWETLPEDLYIDIIIFGGLTFVLSFIMLIVSNYFGLYGSLMSILFLLFFMWFSTIATLIEIYIYSEVIFVDCFKWFTIPGNVAVSFELLIDRLSITYVFLILSIGIFVLIYSFSYFRYEPHVDRLFILITLFMISMCILVLSGNLFTLFLGWELIGLTSFFLINFWSTKISSLKSAFKAFTFNKFSDLNLLLFIIFNIAVSNDANIVALNSTFANFIDYKINFFLYKISYIELISFFLVSAAFVKSAQFGFHVWLPDSMDAPVPASALIHSATLVSAGIFLILRFSYLFELTGFITFLVILLGSITAAFGGVVACFQSDTKRVLAYSTISHCGFLMYLAIVSNLEVTLLYLCVHGFFKAIVFMCVGNVIRFAGNYQDLRHMGKFFKYLPFESYMMLVGLINLGGLPLTYGFVIKHYLLLNIFDFNNFFVTINLIIGMLTSIIYSYRLYYFIFFDTKKAKKYIYLKASKNSSKSINYTNTTLASNCSIFLLTVVAFLFISFMYYMFFVYGAYYGDVYARSNKKLGDFYLNSDLNELKNLIAFVNWFILIIAVILWSTKYRYQLNYYVLNIQFNFIFIIGMLFYFISLILLN